MFNPSIFENSPPAGIAVLQVVGTEKSKPSLPFVPLRRTDLAGDISGPLAALRLTQTFGYTRDQCAVSIEAIYRFPLPGDAAVRSVKVRFGDVEIVTQLKPASEATQEYEAAKKAGRQAALATREGPNVFTLQVAGLKPDQEIVVTTDYVQLARMEGAQWTLRVPLTTQPRFVRQDERNTNPARGQPLALLSDPGHRFALDLLLQSAASAQSSTHALATEQASDGLRVRLQAGDVIPDRDFVLAWSPVQEEERPALHLLTYTDADGYTYFLALVAPPALRPATTAAREAIVLVDHSGSMQGPKWQAADWAVERFLLDLSEHDLFALGWFHNQPDWFQSRRWRSNSPSLAAPQTVTEAIAWLKKSTSSGGTELGVALEQALSKPRSSDERARHLLVITDAAVTDAGRILRLADAEQQHPQRRRISVLCIDAAPNDYLARQLAERGGGVARFLTSEPDAEDVTTALDELLADWSEPLLVGMRLAVNRPIVETSERQVMADAPGWCAIDLGDLAAGRATWVVGRTKQEVDNTLSFRLHTGGAKTIAAVDVMPGEESSGAALKALFGAHRINALEYLVNARFSPAELTEHLTRLGYSAEEMLSAAPKQAKVYAENVEQDSRTALAALLLKESLAYGLASSAVAFVAVRSEAGEPVAGTVLVANALPGGWSDEFLSQNVYAAQSSRGVLRAMSLSVPSLMAPPGAMQAPMMAMSPAPRGSAPSANGTATIFSGAPNWQGDQALLFDSSSDRAALPNGVTFTSVRLTITGGSAAKDSRLKELTLLVYVGDLAAPRARIRLSDLARKGERPLNLARNPGDVVRAVLQTADASATPPLSFELALTW